MLVGQLPTMLQVHLVGLPQNALEFSSYWTLTSGRVKFQQYYLIWGCSYLGCFSNRKFELGKRANQPLVEILKSLYMPRSMQALDNSEAKRRGAVTVSCHPASERDWFWPEVAMECGRQKLLPDHLAMIFNTDKEVGLCDWTWGKHYSEIY